MSEKAELSKDLGFFAVFATATGTMIGAGIFILPGIAAAGAGPGAALSFLFAGLIAGVAALSVSELATAMPKAGGAYYFASRSMGPILGAIVGLGAWLALIFKGSFALIGLAEYLFIFLPAPILTMAVIGGAVLIGINLLGANVSGMVQNIIVVFLLLILSVFVFEGFFAMDYETLTPLLPFGWSGVASTTGLVFISYLGLLKVAAIGEEVVDPGRTLPRAILSSVVVVTLLYVGVMLIITGVIPLPDLVESTTPLTDAGTVFLGVIGGIFIAVAGLLATTSTGNAAILSSSRYPFAMARDGLMTPWLNEIHQRFRTPFRSIWVTGAIMLALLLLFNVEELAKLGSAFNIIVLALTNIALILLRRTDPDWYNPAFKAPLYPWLQIAGTVAALALLPQMGLLAQAAALAFIVLGVAWYYWHRKMEGVEIQPEYGLIDQVQRVRQVQALETQKEHLIQEEPAQEPEGTEAASIVVELVTDKPNRHLLTIAAGVARRQQARIDAVLVTEVPIQSPLQASLPEPDPEFVAKIRDRCRHYGCPVQFHHVLAHDRDRAILNLIDETTHMVLLDWHEEFHKIRIKDSHVDRVLKQSPVRVAVLKYRGIEEFNRILVATATGPYAHTQVEMADAIADLTGARLTFLMVLASDASAEREQHAKEYLKELQQATRNRTDLQVVRGDSISAEIIETSEAFDLVIVGASRGPGYRHYLFGQLPDIIAGYSKQSVLMTKEPATRRAWTEGLVNFFVGQR